MGAGIPRRIRQDVVKQWLNGISRDENAKINGIGHGSVTNIIKEALQFDPELLLLRQVAVIFRKQDLQLTEVASSIRIHRILHNMGLEEEEKVEAFLENLSIHCFKSGLRDNEFIDIINYVSSLLQNLKVRL